LDGWLIKCFSFYTYKRSSEHWALSSS
jgi:hypothetical protein